jgi:hypothetical protein
MTLENYGPKGECLNNNHQTSQKLLFCVFYHNNFKDTKGIKMADPILESSLKTRLTTIYCDIFIF